MSRIKKILRKFTIWYLKIHKPEIIAITGSVGKTTTRRAILTLIEKKFKTNVFSEAGYNTEIGLPLYILKEKAPTKKIFWIFKLIKCFLKVFSPYKIEKLVLEMGADKPGDISYLLSFIKPNISVVTAVAPAHLENFKTIDNVFKEKAKIVKVLPSWGFAILNIDDERVRKMASLTKAKVLYFGFSKNADVYANNIRTSLEGTTFNLNFKDKSFLLNIKSVGRHSLYPILAASACGLVLGFNEEEIVKILSGFTPFKGRMNIIPGINESFLIDDSYNSNPRSSFAALKALNEIAPKRKIAVLGTMNELGDYFLKAHQELGKDVAKLADILVAVGEGGKVIAESAKLAGMSEDKIFVKENSDEAGDFLKNFIKPQDTVLFKGSQNNVRLEKAVKKLMREPEKAQELLVRQDKFWERKN